MSIWTFTCALGLNQDICGQAYTPDKQARGYGVWKGCPSCEHRQPYNAETHAAEVQFALLDTENAVEVDGEEGEA